MSPRRLKASTRGGTSFSSRLGRATLTISPLSCSETRWTSSRAWCRRSARSPGAPPRARSLTLRRALRRLSTWSKLSRSSRATRSSRRRRRTSICPTPLTWLRPSRRAHRDVTAKASACCRAEPRVSSVLSGGARPASAPLASHSLRGAAATSAKSTPLCWSRMPAPAFESSNTVLCRDFWVPVSISQRTGETHFATIMPPTPLAHGIPPPCSSVCKRQWCSVHVL
mmetsp:Transcript_13810/g.29928  ORF Transcript_13810/g.29928 Transcript_13810/m.29928 type:complete len:226 (-) Transcript_13810:246-923(-)